MRYWPKYVPVAKRRAEAAKVLKSARGMGKALNPDLIEGRQIAHTFWGKAWCDNLEAYSDYANRLPRGRTYVRNGSVIDLQILKGKVQAQVMGSSLYKITIEFGAMQAQKWKTLVQACAGKIDSLIELLQGKFSKGVMAKIIDKESGLFPSPGEISMRCSCPDDAGVCKHIAAVFYGIGATLDTQPEQLFTLRHVDHLELIASAGSAGIMPSSQANADALGEEDLSSLFGIEMAPAGSAPLPTPAEERQPAQQSVLPTPPKMTRPSPAKQIAPPAPPKMARPAFAEESVELTLPQAALLLQISSQRLTRLLDGGEIPFRLEGKQKRIAFEAVMHYRKKQR
jgi:uncharacterized Zn finger protein